MRLLSCRPPVSMIAGPLGGEGRSGSREVVKRAKRDWRAELGIEMLSRVAKANLCQVIDNFFFFTILIDKPGDE